MASKTVIGPIPFVINGGEANMSLKSRKNVSAFSKRNNISAHVFENYDSGS